MSSPTSPYDPTKHPRGYAGRWTSGPGKSSNAHAMKGPVRPRPDPFKREHAVSPTTPYKPRTVGIKNARPAGGE